MADRRDSNAHRSHAASATAAEKSGQQKISMCRCSTTASTIGARTKPNANTETIMTTKTLNLLARQIHQANINWWRDIKTGKPIKRNHGELLMLTITEIAEACEGVRKNLMDDKLPHRKMEEVEMADAAIRLFDFAGGTGLKLEHLPADLLPTNKGEAMLLICLRIVKIYFSCIDKSVAVSKAIRQIEQYCEQFSLDLSGAMREKLAYNATRLDHQHEHRKTKHGKKF